MEFIFEFIGELLLDGSMELAQEKKAPRWVRVVALSLITIVYVLFAGVLGHIAFVENDDIVPQVIIGGIILMITILFGNFWRKFIRTSKEMDYYKSMTIRKISQSPELEERAVEWFASKWNIPREAYEESMRASIVRPKTVPQWYVIMDKEDHIVAGAGIIENDFHERKDLSPNVCALFVEREHRNKGLAHRILDYVRKDAGVMGYKEVYLITDHKDIYEKCGWEYLTNVKCDDGEVSRIYKATTI